MGGDKKIFFARSARESQFVPPTFKIVAPPLMYSYIHHGQHSIKCCFFKCCRKQWNSTLGETCLPLPQFKVGCCYIVTAGAFIHVGMVSIIVDGFRLQQLVVCSRGFMSFCSHVGLPFYHELFVCCSLLKLILHRSSAVQWAMFRVLCPRRR